jgi:Leishmanolysin
LPDYQSSLITNLPPSNCQFPTTIDDLYICGKYEIIDGAGGILAFARPTWLRTDGLLPVTGEMTFDSADVARLRSSGTLTDVILHEMGHVLGIGTMWPWVGVTGQSYADCPYYGTNANREYAAITGCQQVPTELDGAEGTRCGHFDDECLNSEMMTGYFNNEGGNPISKISIGSLHDLGYTGVDYSKADAYTPSHVNSKCICNRRLLQEIKNTTADSGSRTSPFRQTIRRRKLSAEGLEIATNFGKAMLAKDKAEHDKATSRKYNNDLTYVGADVVSVLYIEENNIYGVIVTNKE